jgi:transposase InsO family protein
MDLIYLTDSDFCSPIVLVKKKSGEERFCCDYRKLNAATVPSSFQMPSVEHKRNKLHGSKWYSSVDAISSFWAVSMTERAQRFSAFVCGSNVYAWRRLPFGLISASQTFMKIIEQACKPLEGSTTAFVDDLLTYSKTFAEHLIHLEKLFEKLKEIGIKLKPSKCNLATNKTTFLGHEISGEGISTCPEKIKPILDYPRPKNQREIKQFLGMCGFYRIYVEHFSDKVDCLNKLLKKNCKFIWDEECEGAFKSLKEALISAPILAYPCFEQDFHIATDASQVGLGAVLFQVDENGNERPIFYASRGLNKAERRYSTIERELMGIIFATQKFKYYLLGRRSIAYCDHKPIQYLNNLTIENARLTRFRLKLAEFDLQIKWRKGSDNAVPDALSRIEQYEPEGIHTEELIEEIFAIESKLSNIEKMNEPITYIDGNMWQAREPNICVTASSDFESKNSMLVEAINKFNGLDKLKINKAQVGDCISQIVEDGQIVNYLITKKSAYEKTNFETLNQCFEQLNSFCQKYSIKETALAKEGYEFDKLEWNGVEKLINKNLVANGIAVRVYTNKNSLKINAIQEVESIENKIKRLQKEDETIKNLKIKIELNKAKEFVKKDGVLLKLKKGNIDGKFYRQLVVPKSLKLDVLELCHDHFWGGHLGEKRTWDKLKARFWWPNAYNETLEYVRSCEKCARLKPPAPNRPVLDPYLDFEKPFDVMGIDILELSTTESGNRYVLVATDYLTRYTEVHPMKDMKAATVADILVKEIITRHSAPSKLLSDRGVQFLANVMKETCKYFKINKIFTSVYHPAMDGLTERYNKTLCQLLSVYGNEHQSNWDQYISLVNFAYLTAKQSSTEESPFKLLFGREPRLPADIDSFNKGYEPSEFIKNLNASWIEAKENLIKHAEANKRLYDSKHSKRPMNFEEGKFVREKQQLTKIGLKKKLRNDFWSEPREITKVISEQNIEIKMPNGKVKRVNTNNVKKAEKPRKSEFIRTTPTLLKTGRVSIPRIS